MTNNFLIVFFLGILLTASSFVASNCTVSDQFVKGTQYTTTTYDATGKVKGTLDATVSEIESEGVKTVAIINTVSKDAKGAHESTAQYNFVCKNGVMYMDIMPEAGNDAYGSYTGDKLEYPAVITVGQTLPAGRIAMKGKQVSVVMTIAIKERKCTAIESRTTSAGTWECYKITGVQECVTKVGGVEMDVARLQYTEWFSHKVGVVRTETLSNGKLQDYSEMTSFKKGQ